MSPEALGVKILDDVLPEAVRQAISEIVSKTKISLGANRVELDDRTMRAAGLFSTIRDIVGFDYRVQDMFLTPAARTADVHMHLDTAFAFYITEPWNPEWNSGTVFFNSNKSKVLSSVPYKSWRVVMIPAGLIHAIIPPVCEMQENRMSITVLIRGLDYANSTS